MPEKTKGMVNDMEQTAVPLARTNAAAAGEGDAILRLDRQYTLVTSEDIVPHEIEVLLNSNGGASVHSTACAQMVIAYMNSKAKVVGPAKEPPQQQPAQ